MARKDTRSKAEYFIDKVNYIEANVERHIESIIRRQPNWYLQVDDIRGNLIIKEIDDQESEVIHSVTVREYTGGEEKVIVWHGVHSEDESTQLTHLPLNLKLQVLQAMEIATR